MRLRPFALIKALVVAIVVIAVAAAAGGALGYGLSKVKDRGGTTVPSFSTAAAPTGATGATGATGTAEATTPVRPMRIKVVAVQFTPATTADGQTRRRARVAVRLRVVGGSRASSLRPIRLVSGKFTALRDSNATPLARALLEPIPPRETVTGEFRFETSGDMTDALSTRREATLRLGGTSRRLRFGPAA